MVKACCQNELGRSAFKILTGRTRRKRPLERCKLRWKGIIRNRSLKKYMSTQEIRLIRLKIEIIGDPL